jgi:type I restriction enzyme, S subunit
MRIGGTKTMNPDWLLKYFDQISEAPNAIPHLRRFILDLAVRGKLVEQNPEDEPITALFEKIDRERTLTAKKDRRAEADLQEPLADQLCWEVPPTWRWRALADFVLFIDYRGKTPSKVNSGIRLIKAKNVRWGFIDLQPEEFVTESTYGVWMTRGLPHEGVLRSKIGILRPKNSECRFTTAERCPRRR